MKLLKKIAVSVHSRVENMADQFENKEALSTAYIQEYERLAAKSKVKLTQVEKNVQRLEGHAAKVAAEKERWAERARWVRKDDENKALACVERMIKCKAEHDKILKNIEETKKLQQKMRSDVEHILCNLDELKRKHQNLTGRQACAEAAQAIHQSCGNLNNDIDDFFSRWETDVVTSELHYQVPSEATDALADEFDTVEHKESLRKTLDELIATNTPDEEVNND